jgi:hypothetical protein
LRTGDSKGGIDVGRLARPGDRMEGLDREDPGTATGKKGTIERGALSGGSAIQSRSEAGAEGDEGVSGP